MEINISNLIRKKILIIYQTLQRSYNMGVNMYGFDVNLDKIFYYTHQDTIQRMDTIGVKQNIIKNLGKKL